MKRLWVAATVLGLCSSAVAGEDIWYTYDALGRLRQVEGRQNLTGWLVAYYLDSADNRRGIEAFAGVRMTRGQRLNAPSGKVHLDFQTDGNLCLYRDGRTGPLWCAPANYGDSQLAALQVDGNFVVYDSRMAPLWSSNTQGNPHAFLAVQDDGNLVVYRADKVGLWATMTNGL